MPFDLIASRLIREPFNQPWTEIRKLDPISARLLFFRDPEWDEIWEPASAAPPQLRSYTRFVENFQKQGYNEEQADRLWTHYQKKLEEQRKKS